MESCNYQQQELVEIICQWLASNPPVANQVNAIHEQNTRKQLHLPANLNESPIKRMIAKAIVGQENLVVAVMNAIPMLSRSKEEE